MVKVILGTITITLIVMTIVASLFMNIILGFFGQGVVSLEAIQGLKASEQIVKKMKNRHKTKRVNLTKRLVKKSSKKIAASSVAATVGPAGVILVLGYFEAEDYCHRQGELLADENILFGTNKEFDIKTCLSTAKVDLEEIAKSSIAHANVTMEKTWEDTMVISKNAWQQSKELSNGVWNSAKKLSKGAWKGAKGLGKDESNSAIETADYLLKITP